MMSQETLGNGGDVGMRSSAQPTGYRFIDWVLKLPEPLELKYTDTIFQIEERLKMPYVSFVERRGEARGEVRRTATMILQQRATVQAHRLLVDRIVARELVHGGSPSSSDNQL
jgi:hypothetical protein